MQAAPPIKLTKEQEEDCLYFLFKVFDYLDLKYHHVIDKFGINEFTASHKDNPNITKVWHYTYENQAIYSTFETAISNNNYSLSADQSFAELQKKVIVNRFIIKLCPDLLRLNKKNDILTDNGIVDCISREIPFILENFNNFNYCFDNILKILNDY